MMQTYKSKNLRQGLISESCVGNTFADLSFAPTQDTGLIFNPSAYSRPERGFGIIYKHHDGQLISPSRCTWRPFRNKVCDFLCNITGHVHFCKYRNRLSIDGLPY